MHLRALSFSAFVLAGLCAGSAAAQTVTVIHTEIPGSPTAVVPGAKDALGNPATADFTALEDLNVSHDGSEWILKSRAAGLGSTLDSFLHLGSGLTGTVFAQDGQPMLGGMAGEEYDFFDTPSPASWDERGNIVLSFRAKGGVSGTLEKVVRYDRLSHTLVMQQGDPLLGLVDVVANPTGDETLGNSVGAVHGLNSGLIAFSNTPIQNCHSSRYPGLFHGNTGFRQSGVSAIGAEIWDSFTLSGFGSTPDGAHWFAIGDTENANTGIDEIFVVDDVVIVQETTTVLSNGMVVDDTFGCRMLPNGDWFARGDDGAMNDWAMRNGVLVVASGDPITTGSGELFGSAIGVFTGNRNGEWVVAGNTDNANTDLDNVMVMNGTTVLFRENDPVDVDGNGLFDDDAFINAFQPDDAYLLDSGDLYVMITMRNGAGTAIGDGLLFVDRCPGDVTPYGAGCAGAGGYVPFLTMGGCPTPGGAIAVNMYKGAGGAPAGLILGASAASLAAGGGCTLLVTPSTVLVPLTLTGTNPGEGSVTLPATMPPVTTPLTFYLQGIIGDPANNAGFTLTNGLEVTVN